MSGMAAILEDVIEEQSADGVLIQDVVTYFVQGDSAEWEAACEWARFHGLDPNAIPFGSLITRNQRTHTIIYPECCLDDKGQLILNRYGDLVTRIRTEQGEAGPLPFPAIITELPR